jgi:ketosteroid isomerase-like protein
MAEHPNAEVVRRGYSAFANADIEGIQSLFADDVVSQLAAGVP